MSGVQAAWTQARRRKQRAAASAHCLRINSDPATRRRQVDGRRGVKIPIELEPLYLIARRKVGKAAALAAIYQLQKRLEKASGR